MDPPLQSNNDNVFPFEFTMRTLSDQTIDFLIE